MNPLERQHDLLCELMSRTADQGGIPAPDAYTPDGQPLWSLDALAQFFGKTPKQIEVKLEEAFAEVADVLWAGPVHRRQ